MNRLKELRQQSEMTQQQLSDKSGIKLVTIQKIENGTNSMLGAKTETTLKLARALNMTVENLIGEL